MDTGELYVGVPYDGVAVVKILLVTSCCTRDKCQPHEQLGSYADFFTLLVPTFIRLEMTSTLKNVLIIKRFILT